MRKQNSGSTRIWIKPWKRSSTRGARMRNRQMGELAKQVGQIIYDVAGSAAREIGEMIKDEIKPYRAARQMLLAEKTVRRLQEAEIKPVAVAPKILLSVFENAGLEDDEEMHDRWATLLANAAT